ncbi:ImmA/IrrE family metallo-endopeptidase [Bradyrhizobium sp. 1]|uniref:ImmA/IrrE family metallo-endopeptidase n=1 Tax=Bradyrhizobium sp. 1 TaxID=241591 RepID=UPI001FF86756|nr:ImmA/IrrE family metallo-endopeptidase [Bradyrhizobium sp. 1]
MRRGFKAQAEKSAATARQLLGLSPTVPFDPRSYATHLGIIVLDFEVLGLPAAAVRQLTEVDQDGWSAMTIQEDGVFGVVLNPAHAATRQRYDLMHELAHIELKHVPARVEVSPSGLMLLSDFSDEQEQEADWYAGSFLLPREGIFRLRSRGKSAAEIGIQYGVSKALCEYRLRMTGVDIQMRRGSER